MIMLTETGLSIRDYFRKTRKTASERNRMLRDSGQILAWMEELARLGTELDLAFSGSEVLPTRGAVVAVDEASGALTVLLQWKPSDEPSVGHRIVAVFPMDGQRFQAELAYLGRGHYLEYRFSLPPAILHAERRDSVRVKMLPEDTFGIVVLQSLADGLGLAGRLVDLSMGGCCFLLTRVVHSKGEGKVPITPDLMPPGTPLAVVRLPDLPDLPLVECGGYLCYMRETEQGMIAGIRFESLGSFENGILGKFLSERSPGFSFGFPQKRRRRDLTEGELKLPQPCGAVAVPEELEPQPDPDEEELPIREAFTDRERLNQIRKRGKKIMLVMADDLERMLFMAMLHQDGYRCFFEASSLVQALNHQRKVPLDLLVVDQVLGHMEALNIIDLLRDKGLPQEVPVLVVRKKYDVRLTLAAKAGKVSLLLERPLDFAGVVKPAVEGMFRLQADA
jgi:CheY-like chemotaxis protein